MSNVAEVDVMNSLLFSSGATDLPGTEELNKLLYRNVDDPVQVESNLEVVPSTAGGERISVQMSKNRALIRVRVSRNIGSKISIDKIAESAVSAITHELQKVKS